MRYNPEKHHRGSIRLKGYDYVQAGSYFVTICTIDRTCLFGEVVNEEMRLNPEGQIVHDEWIRSAMMRPRVILDLFVVMPNHLHGIIMLVDWGRGTLQRAPTMERFGKPTSGSIPTIIRLFKSATTKRINELRGAPGIPVWQRNYYEHVIRNEASLSRIRQYIVENPARWAFDRENRLAVTLEPENAWLI
jgi:REP element-mobilizing transposase RayT